MYYVYILLCSDNKYYIGFTSNHNKRINEHKKGLSFSTSYRLSFTVKWVGAFQNKEKAIKFEKYLKTGSGIAFKLKRLV